ncbi:histidine phosphatase family protein [Paenibacillus sp. NEAU-GSW1]|uniref:histidine phosphatase family protein n=1 Tax=Paenibacillus sp. NEAU-GSW1 TaxID=2682486 RepID=UPI0012E2B1E0|nr:histidine phosphatase family protein [Paenibacillus sp. NEAU-GSW1]MUT67689.1 histidine phosphatase family protein [Paenibacillus sp. NEAU-GSW1]
MKSTIATKIGWIRHGSTAWNKEGRAQGHSDIPLDEEGLEQAELLGRRLSGEQWDVIYSSDLMRARVTAETVAKHLGIGEVNIDPRLREASGGLTEGTTEAERIVKWGANWRELDLKRETPESVVGRGSKVLEEIAERHPGQNVLVVSHGALIGQCMKAWVPNDYVDEHLINTSISTICSETGEGGGWVCERFNCAKHLESAAKH